MSNKWWRVRTLDNFNKGLNTLRMLSKFTFGELKNKSFEEIGIKLDNESDFSIRAFGETEISL